MRLGFIGPAETDAATLEQAAKLLKLAAAYRNHLGAKKLFGIIKPKNNMLPSVHRNAETAGRLYNLYWGWTRWKTLIPRRAHDETMKLFTELEKPMWVVQTYQIGGDMLDYEPSAPTSLLIQPQKGSIIGSVCRTALSYLFTPFTLMK